MVSNPSPGGEFVKVIPTGGTEQTYTSNYSDASTIEMTPIAMGID